MSKILVYDARELIFLTRKINKFNTQEDTEIRRTVDYNLGSKMGKDFVLIIFLFKITDQPINATREKIMPAH